MNKLQKISKQMTADNKKNQYITLTKDNQTNVNFTKLLDHNDKTTCECIVILNYQINLIFLQILIQKCKTIVLVDGGSNRLYETKFRDSAKIKVIVGDLDSAKPEIIKYYSSKGVQVRHMEDQDYTDFQKAIQYVDELGLKNVACFGSLGGRLDHTLSSMHNVIKVSKVYEDLKIWLIGKTSMMFYISPNKHTIHLKTDLIYKKYCGLVPFGKVNTIQTKGFKWNLGKNQAFHSLQWGSFISTSNQIIAQNLQIFPSEGIFFIAQIKQTHQNGHDINNQK